MSNEDFDRLNKKIADFRDTEQPKPTRTQDEEAQNMNNGARAGLELVTSILAGVAIGWMLDNWLHTRPWLLLVFTLLGVGAGFMSVYRISNNLGSSVGFAALQKGQKTGTKPPTIDNAPANLDEDDD